MDKMYYRLQFKAEFDSEIQARTYIDMLVKDGWNREHFEIVQVS